MEDEELQELRRRRLEELQRKQSAAAEEQRQREMAEAHVQSIMRKILTPEARERLARLKIAHPDTVAAVENQLVALAQSGRLNQVIDDVTLQQILQKIMPQKREINIKRI